VRGLSLVLRGGEIVALLGPNGAGKTTTLRMLAGLIPPSEGHIALGGVPLTRMSADSLRRHVGVLTESPGLWDRLSVRLNLLTYARLYGLAHPREAVARTLERVGLTDRARDAAGTLSKGLRQRLALARALMHDPAILLLDEPTSGLDPASARQVRDMIAELRQQGRALLVSTHNLFEAEELADRIAILQTRLLANDRPAALRQSLSGFRLDIECEGPAERWIGAWRPGPGETATSAGSVLTLTLKNRTSTPDVIAALVAAGARIHRATPGERSLEEVYLSLVDPDAAESASEPGPPRGAEDTASAPCAADPEQSAAGGDLMLRHVGARGKIAASLARVRGLLIKDVAELWKHPGAIVPALTVALAALVPAFLVAVLAPRLSGERLGDSAEFSAAANLAAARIPELARLEGDSLVQAFLFHQFGVLLLMVPVVGSMALAAHAVIGEKMARTLEPMLATPLSTAELLAAKTLTPLMFSLAVLWATFGLYVSGIAWLAAPGVWQTLVGARAGMLFLVLGPLLALVSLLLAVIVSSRVNDPRSAQQMGALVVLPISGVFVAQLLGQFVLGPGALLMVAVGLVAVNGLLLRAGIWVFDRERILMRWK
jgi:ABC-2 type transport system ATP-binding protein